MYVICWSFSKHCFIIDFKDSPNPFRYKMLSKKMNINLLDLTDFLEDQFNGFKDGNGEIFFKTKEDAEKVLEWIETTKLINKLGDNEQCM